MYYACTENMYWCCTVNSSMPVPKVCTSILEVYYCLLVILYIGPSIFVFKSKSNVCSESKEFKFFQFQKYDETFESRKWSHNEIMHSSSQ